MEFLVWTLGSLSCGCEFETRWGELNFQSFLIQHITEIYLYTHPLYIEFHKKTYFNGIIIEITWITHCRKHKHKRMDHSFSCVKYRRQNFNFREHSRVFCCCCFFVRSLKKVTNSLRWKRLFVVKKLHFITKIVH